MTKQLELNSTQEPEFFKNKSGIERQQWLDGQLAIMRKGADEGKTAEIKPEALQALLYMFEQKELKYCEVVTMHHNAVVTMACAAIENNIDSMSDWLFEALDQADCPEWQMYKSSQEFFERNYLPWPENQEEHRQNIKANKLIAQEDSEKFQIWYEQNVVPKLEKSND